MCITPTDLLPPSHHPLLSGEPAASGQHWVQRPRPAGPTAAWQGNECDNAIVSASRAVCCAPPLCCPFHWESPCQARGPTQGFSLWFPTGLCEGGHPDEGQQEEPPATTLVFGKRSYNFRHLNSVFVCGRWLLLHQANVFQPITFYPQYRYFLIFLLNAYIGQTY